MIIDRRTFLKITSAGLVLLARDPFKALGAEKPHPRLRIGLTSDIHIAHYAGNWTNADGKFEQCLRFFDKEKVDGVLISGDLADSGVKIELQHVAEIWFKVFPDGKRSDGETMVNLIHYGDHDTGGYLCERPGFLKRHRLAGKTPEEIAAFKKENLLLHHREQDWEDCFHEKFVPLIVKNVKGYDFILAQFDGRKNDKGYAAGLAEFFAKYQPKSGQPFFFSQHRVPKGTAPIHGYDKGYITKLLSASPIAKQCLLFCGHSHKTCMNDLPLWRGAFNCVQIPTCRNPSMPKGGYQNTYENGSERDPLDTQCLIMNVYDEFIEIRRCDYHKGIDAAQAWKI